MVGVGEVGCEDAQRSSRRNSFRANTPFAAIAGGSFSLGLKQPPQKSEPEDRVYKRDSLPNPPHLGKRVRIIIHENESAPSFS